MGPVHPISFRMGSKALLQLLKFRIRYLSLTNQEVCLLGRLFSLAKSSLIILSKLAFASALLPDYRKKAKRFLPALAQEGEIW